MKRLFEFCIFVALAAGMHIMLAMKGPDSGGATGGAGGEAYITLAGASAQIETVLEEWTRPPAVQDVLDLEQPSFDTPEAAPVAVLEMDHAPRAALTIAALAPSAPPKAPDVSALQSPITPPPAMTLPALQMQPTTPDSQPDKPASKQDARPAPQSQPRPKTPVIEAALVAPTSPPPPDPTPAPKKKVQKKTAKPKKDAQRADKAQKASAGSTAQKAAGSGGGSEAGTSGKVNALGKGQSAKLKAIWGSKIQARIERNKRAPRGEKGSAVVQIRMSVAADGRLVAVSVAKSSGIAAFDTAALQAVKRAKRFAKAPKKLPQTNHGFIFKMRFNIR
ncbi:energy transducer TonB [Shimia sp. MMG029]|uniref:energy transducer TonB n=1 Tax=Shimia sp. MMG029 TaxID=3021978 RepID=UPI0022FF18E2|nr:TonB family protein [Shimia sp. MMG029]MDA5558780.1 TonB family protein [Shimia sp. MMG029]